MTPSQLQALEDIERHGDPWRRVRGQSQHGGWHGVMRVVALKKKWARRSTRGWRLTAAGKEALSLARARRTA